MVIPISLCKSAAKKILEELTTLLTNKYNLYSSFEEDFINLKNDMSAISAVLLDAEKKQEKNHLVEDWLKKLQDALHDAEDLLDDINAEALRQKVEAECKIVTVVRNMFFFSDMDVRIKKITVRIDEIANRISSLHLQKLDQHQETASNRQRVNRTISYLRCSTEVVGREEDKKYVIERLLGGGSNSNNVVLPIVGIGGLGKTALVNLIFDDERVKNGFDLRFWVDVSDDWNRDRVWQKKVVRAVDRSDEIVQDIDFLSSCLKVSEKKFLLVLDDVWNCKRKDWLDLKNLFLANCARGSRIVATTRYKITASFMGENEIGNSLYQLGGLADGDCRLLFEKWAFGEGERVQHPNLVKIGEEIVMKCDGVPLAIRTVGGLLSGTKDESYWMSVKNSDTWSMSHLPEEEDGIMAVLKLSYDQLPSPFKECFAYCSLLPKGKEFDKQDLIHLWMAQGFIQPSNNDQLEDVGNWYINEFVSRSIFEIVHENHKTEIVKCRMHDLFHDLAKLVAGNLMVNSVASNMSESTRHISFWDQAAIREDPSLFLKLPKLRTLLLCIKLGPHLNVFLSGSTYLRALDVSNMGITILPNSIGNMKHLRYLNLNGNSELQFLPNSICSLHFLQTLKLSGCRKISTFPRKFSHLVSLRHLVITSPNVFEKQLGTLTSLRSLTIEHCRSLVSMNEVTQNLTLLRTLRIHNCAKLTSLPSSLKNCTSLENLEVVNCPMMESLDVCIESLSSLRSLTIKGLRKLRTLPRKPEFYATSLQYLFIIDCVSLMTLPDFVRNLTSLMRVHIRYCPNLLNLPVGFGHLTSLQVLQIDGCHLLSRRCQRIAGEDWEKIAHVREIYVDNVRI
ncbi:putative P-loop containing nucleoside triphosphate hydrolase, leucine-rich repeat domain, L [Medicago truncatula]|uniref:LRR and NB-ARC domain disease resistance protein n=2 Tax=Medicago truncatula TaxID=3880 RepID=A0A072TPW8_MEDTR|nr:disease resistance protein RGA2 [Medicago truncatula]KEH19261.1 LRR and NB-ARC domain disease resistance protein [Medicago truncatula]RHN40503.1 putative P-loop containing nucleoside triphosphate hydrolase, leucine-rich repeat domain, L [Medicago truncatula]